MIIEVSYSQKEKYLPQLADNYILGPDAHIKVVVGIDDDKRTIYVLRQFRHPENHNWAVLFFVILERLESARNTHYEETLPEVYKALEILLQTECGDGTGQGAS